jgi:hypothetical protein
LCWEFSKSWKMDEHICIFHLSSCWQPETSNWVCALDPKQRINYTRPNAVFRSDSYILSWDFLGGIWLLLLWSLSLLHWSWTQISWIYSARFDVNFCGFIWESKITQELCVNLSDLKNGSS